jgi:hypothetical protein
VWQISKGRTGGGGGGGSDRLRFTNGRYRFLSCALLLQNQDESRESKRVVGAAVGELRCECFRAGAWPCGREAAYTSRRCFAFSRVPPESL